MPATPLAGFTVGVTAARRHEELGSLLERRGARVTHAPAIEIMPLADDAELLRVTSEILAQPVHDLIVTTGIGFRAWLEAADGWGLRETLVERLRDVRILTRGPKARGAVRAAGLDEAWSPDSECTGDVVRHLLDSGLGGRRVAVQLYGEALPGPLAGSLGRAGAEVVEIPVYRWARARDTTPLRRLIGQAVTGTVDAITFTSAPAVMATLAVADEEELGDRLLEALRSEVVAACVGPITASALEEQDVRTVQPERGRLGALVRALAADLPARRARPVVILGCDLEIRGHAVILDGQLRPVPPAPMAILRALARQPGHVVSRTELCDALPGRVLSGSQARADEHAVEMAVARLRRRLGRAGIVETVVKRGYRLACEPATAR